MAVSEEYEIKFHIYDGNEKDVEQILPVFIRLRDLKKNEEGVMAKVQIHFLNGLISLVESDIKFWNNAYREAFLGYQEASRLFNNFIISRTVKVKLDKFVARLYHRSLGMKLITEAMLQTNNAKKAELLLTSLEEFNKEVSITNEMEEQMSSYAAFARASFAQSQLLFTESVSLPPNQSGLAKKKILDGKEAIRQSCFIDTRFTSFLDSYNDELDKITRKRLLAKAETHADNATIAMEDGSFTKAASNFHAASLFYKRASLLASETSTRRMLLASATLYEASIKEAAATAAQKEVNTDEASSLYKDAMNLVEKAIALLGHFGTQNLKDSFISQKDFYKAIYTHSLAIKQFDLDGYKEAKELFNEAKVIFIETKDLASKLGNDSIVTVSTDTIAEINSYITMCENLE